MAGDERMTELPHVLRSNSVLRRDMPVQKYELLVTAAGAIRRLLPHVTSARWTQGPAQRGGTHFTSPARTEICVCIDIMSETLSGSVSTLVTRSSTGSGGSRTLDTRERALLNEVAMQASRLMVRPASGMTVTDALLYRRHFDELVVALYLRRQHKLEFSVAAFLMEVRRLAEQTYENKSTTFGCVVSPKSSNTSLGAFPEDFFRTKKYRALSDGYRTAYRISRNGRLVGFTDLEAGASDAAHWYPEWSGGLAAEATAERIGIALTRQGDILVFERGSLRLAYRFGQWHYWNHAHLINMLRTLCRVQNVKPKIVGAVVRGLYRAALDVAFRRTGGLFVVLRNAANLRKIVRTGDSIGDASRSSVDAEFDSILEGAKLQAFPRSTLAEIAGLDGAVVVDNKGRFRAYGAVLHVRDSRRPQRSEGSRTKAAIAASAVGLAVKVSSDGDIAAYWRGEKVFEV